MDLLMFNAGAVLFTIASVIIQAVWKPITINVHARQVWCDS